MNTRYAVSVTKEGRWYVAQCLDVDLASQGRTVKSALANLRAALTLHFTPPVATRKPRVTSIEVSLRAA
jgi:predicted RNase H-like HicB family nuclease